jgi:hypothetical protein
MLSHAEAWDHYGRATEFLEGLKNRDADREGTPFPPLLHFSSDFFRRLMTFLICSAG